MIPPAETIVSGGPADRGPGAQRARSRDDLTVSYGALGIRALHIRGTRQQEACVRASWDGPAMDADQHRTFVLDALAPETFSVFAVTEVIAPERAGLVVIEWDSELNQRVRDVLRALAPQVVLVPQRGTDGGFAVHAIGGSAGWVQLLAADPDYEPPEDDTDDAQVDPHVQERARAVLDEASSTLLAAATPPPHQRVGQVVDALTEQVQSTHPQEIEALIRTWRTDLWAVAEELHGALRLAHQKTFRVKAESFAHQLLENEPTLRLASKPVLRSAAYEYMKALDPACATRASVEPVAEAARLLSGKP